MSNTELVAEIARVLVNTEIGEQSPELEACIHEDNTSRGGTCYKQAVKQYNAHMGYREVGPNALDNRKQS